MHVLRKDSMAYEFMRTNKTMLDSKPFAFHHSMYQMVEKAPENLNHSGSFLHFSDKWL